MTLMDVLPEQPTIALFLGGAPFEDFFDTINVSLETFRTEYTGSYMFNYVEALRLAGVRTVLFFISSRTSTPLRFKHQPSGADVCVLPTSILHRGFRRMRQLGIAPEFSITRSLDSYFLIPQKLLAEELQREKCQAILFQDYENPSFDVCVWLGQKINLPVFATFQGRNCHWSKLERLIRPRVVRSSAGLIIASKSELERVSTAYKVQPSKLKQIFNPINIRLWSTDSRDACRAELGISPNAKVVVFHGRISIHHKGLDILLKSWEIICRERPNTDLRLLLVGTGQDSEKLQQLIEAMNLRGVMWLNEFVSSRTAIQKYLSAANVYTLPSRLEGFPVAPIEAMACNLPVVATEVAGIPEIFQFGEASGGVIVPREDPEALASALGKVLDDEAWARALGKQGRLRVEQAFSLEEIGQQLRSFLLQSC